jgi:hypothetical protein
LASAIASFTLFAETPLFATNSSGVSPTRLIGFHRVVRHPGIERRVHREPVRDQHDRVSVGRRTRRELHADHAVRPRAVVHDELLAERVSEALGHVARLDVGVAAGRIGYDQADGAGGVGVRGVDAGRKRRHGETEGDSVHGRDDSRRSRHTD